MPFRPTLHGDGDYYLVSRTRDAEAAPVRAFCEWLLSEAGRG
jgi:hypothetical protein